MSQSRNALLLEHEGRLELALQAYKAGQFRSYRAAADAFNVKFGALCRRARGTPFRLETPPNCRILTPTEEHSLVEYILDLDSRGFPPTLAEVADMADHILGARGAEKVGKNWTERFVERKEELKTAFNRAKDRQRILREDPVEIDAWFTRVKDTMATYGVHPDDVHNFDETGFQMGVIGSMKVVTGSERRVRPDLVQPGDREWVTAIASICAAGYAIPPFIIYKGRVHISAWYEEADIPRNWKISVSENGWTNNNLGLAWLKHFNAYTKERMVGAYRLLLLDGHESHQSWDFKQYCLDNKILTLCMPSHSSHILQPLDVVCFSPLKRDYSRRVRDLARKRVFHINKEGFLLAFKDAFFSVFTTDNCKAAFEASGLVPMDPDRVLDRLNVRIRTPPQPLLLETPWQSKTPSNSFEFSSQSKLISKKFTQSPNSAQQAYAQLVRGGNSLLVQFNLQAARIKELEEQLAVQTKRKTRKRKQIQKGGTLEFGSGADLAVTASSSNTRATKRGRTNGNQEAPSRALRRCGNCGETGHNKITCRKRPEDEEESDASTQFVGSLFDSDSSDDE